MENSNADVDNFLEKKKAESTFLSLDDGESVKVVELKSIKMVTKAGFSGEEKEVLRFSCAVETSEGMKDKNFDNGTQRFAKELQEKGITVGSAFTITRVGLQTKTRYNLSEVTNPGAAPTVEVAQATPTQSTPVANPDAAPAEEPAPVAPVEEVSTPSAPAGQVAP